MISPITFDSNATKAWKEGTTHAAAARSVLIAAFENILRDKLKSLIFRCADRGIVIETSAKLEREFAGIETGALITWIRVWRCFIPKSPKSSRDLLGRTARLYLRFCCAPRSARWPGA